MKMLGFGLMRLPHVGDYNNVDVEVVKVLADEFLKRGFTYFDTAYPYHGGNSETAFRDAVAKRYPRGSYKIADKMPMFSIQSQEQLPQIFDEQLAKCGVDYFDFYLLHCLNRQHYKTAVDLKAFEFVRQKKKEGKIRHIGFSFHDNAELLDKILTEHPEMEFVQLQINYLDIDDINIESGKCYEVAKKHDKDIFVMEPVKGGALANVPSEVAALFKLHSPNASPASWALRYAASFDNVVMVLSGMNSMEQLIENTTKIDHFDPITSEEQAIIQQAAKMLKESVAIQCSECRYCVADCGKKMAIPEYFSIYNNLMRGGPSQKPLAMGYYGNLALSHGKASECDQCGKCESLCPQHLPIIKHLKLVAAELG
jgi:predicted aldo/keto reductase-like oxidoreductase